jgi:hypothetical protein
VLSHTRWLKALTTSGHFFFMSNFKTRANIQQKKPKDRVVEISIGFSRFNRGDGG